MFNHYFCNGQFLQSKLYGKLPTFIFNEITVKKKTANKDNWSINKSR